MRCFQKLEDSKLIKGRGTKKQKGTTLYVIKPRLFLVSPSHSSPGPSITNLILEETYWIVAVEGRRSSWVNRKMVVEKALGSWDEVHGVFMNTIYGSILPIIGGGVESLLIAIDDWREEEWSEREWKAKETEREREKLKSKEIAERERERECVCVCVGLVTQKLQ